MTEIEIFRSGWWCSFGGLSGIKGRPRKNGFAGCSRQMWWPCHHPTDESSRFSGCLFAYLNYGSAARVSNRKLSPDNSPHMAVGCRWINKSVHTDDGTVGSLPLDWYCSAVACKIALLTYKWHAFRDKVPFPNGVSLSGRKGSHNGRVCSLSAFELWRRR